MPKLEIPDFMKNHVGLGTENISPESVVWAGEDGNLDTDGLMAEQGFDPASPLDMIVRAIIAAYPDRDGRSDDTRIEIVKAALFGVPRQRGRKTGDDYAVLQQIAWQYHVQHFNSWGEEIDLAPIIRACITPPVANANPEWWDSETRRLRIKFLAEEDALLVRVTDEMNPARMDKIRVILEVLLQLSSLGVRSDPEVVRPFLRTEIKPA